MHYVEKEFFYTHGQTKQGQLQGMFTCTKLHTCHTFIVNVAGIQYRQQHRVNPFQLEAKAKRLYIYPLGEFSPESPEVSANFT
jgi:hypothetical protein